jgi:DNA-binding XRE family transcriptional regulator
MPVMNMRGSSPIGSVLDDDLSQALASEEYRKLHAELSVAEAVARLVIQLRMKLKMTQQQLAQRMDTSPSTISRLESGQYVPSLATLARVVEAGGMRLVLGFERPGGSGEAQERIVVSV